MNLDQLTIAEARELAALFGAGKKKKKEIKDGGVRIVILQRGWVMVGRYSQVGEDCKLTNCYVIRNWGTTKGLGEIALNGPTDKTILDPAPETEFHILTVVASMKCTEAKWSGKVLA